MFGVCDICGKKIDVLAQPEIFHLDINCELDNELVNNKYNRNWTVCDHCMIRVNATLKRLQERASHITDNVYDDCKECKYYNELLDYSGKCSKNHIIIKYSDCIKKIDRTCEDYQRRNNV